MRRWPVVQVRRLFRIVNGGTPTSEPENWDGPVPWATPIDLGRHHGGRLAETDRCLTEKGLRTGSATVPAGSLVISTRAPIGYVAETEVPLAFNQGCRGLAPTRPLDIRFYRYAFTIARSQLQAAGQGSTFAELSSDLLAEQLVPFPTLAEQGAIAEFLDTETARIDALITKKRRLIEVLDERDRALIEEALAAAATDEVPLRRLLAVPPQYGAAESGEVGSEAWPRYIRITDLTARGGLRSDGLRRLPPEIATRFLLKDGDLLIARSGATVGRSILYRESMGDAAFAGYLIRFRPDTRRIAPELLELWTRTDHYWSQVRQATLQATIENVSADKYVEFLVPVVPRRYQCKIVDRLSVARRKIRQIQDTMLRQVDLLNEHRQALITAAVTGELEMPGVAAA